jgi:hypothetical protein
MGTYFDEKMGLSTFLATFSQIHLVTLTVEAQLR